MASQQYVVSTAERWDNVAFKAYGNPGKIEPLVQANPNVPITPVIAAGTILNVPIFEELETVVTPESLLPPWM